MPYWRLFYHLIWATKERAPIIGEQEQAIIRQSFGSTMTEIDAIPHAIGLMPDHVHLAVSIPPKAAVADVVKRLKGASSHAVNHERNGGFGWQGEYGVLSFGEQALPKVIAYVTNQPARHASGQLWPTLEQTTDNERL